MLPTRAAGCMLPLWVPHIPPILPPPQTAPPIQPPSSSREPMPALLPRLTRESGRVPHLAVPLPLSQHSLTSSLQQMGLCCPAVFTMCISELPPRLAFGSWGGSRRKMAKVSGGSCGNTVYGGVEGMWKDRDERKISEWEELKGSRDHGNAATAITLRSSHKSIFSSTIITSNGC